jgi:hypothetical protein
VSQAEVERPNRFRNYFYLGWNLKSSQATDAHALYSERA